MYQKTELHQVSEEVQALVGLIEGYDLATANHSVRVSRLSALIAQSISSSLDLARRTCISAVVHDVGKTLIPLTLLNKPEKLTTRERETMQAHTTAGYSLIRQLFGPGSMAEIVLYHHEHYDGRGYPYGLSNRQIPIESRIISVADTFDAMTSDRAYHPAAPRRQALKEICRRSDTMFDPLVVRHLFRIFES